MSFLLIFLIIIIIDNQSLLIRGESGEIEKFNIVLFLAKTDGKTNCFDDSGLKCLDFEEKARVKHCALSGHDINSASSSACSSAIMNDCPELLKDSLTSLISYSRNVLGMTTAVASVDNNTFSNDLKMKKTNSDDLENLDNFPSSSSLSLENRLMKRSSNYKIFPSGPRLNFDKSASKRSRHPDLITEPEHTEIFKLRSKRHNQPHHDEDNSKSFLDRLGVLGTIKLTFFDKLLESDNNNKCDDVNEENLDANDNSKSKTTMHLPDQNVKNSCLFNLVKQTLYGLMDTCESSGFLMIVIGGNLNEISDPYSSLVQSVKFVVENTEEKHTLIAVTGLCPPIEEEFITDAQENSQILIPVFVKGPRSDQIEHTTKLYDVPYSLKNILAGISIVEENNLNINRRSKREAAGCKKKRQNKTGPKIAPSLITIILLTSILQYNVL